MVTVYPKGGIIICGKGGQNLRGDEINQANMNLLVMGKQPYILS